MRREIKILQLIALALLIAAPAHRSPGEESGHPAKATYLRYCSACHGESGKGDGVVAHLMRPKPTDLTKLAKQNKGEFPYAQIMRVIDGRGGVPAHGDPDMPVWGEIFQLEDGMTLSTQTRVRGKVMLIVDYLVSIQEK